MRARLYTTLTPCLFYSQLDSLLIPRESRGMNANACIRTWKSWIYNEVWTFSQMVWLLGLLGTASQTKNLHNVRKKEKWFVRLLRETSSHPQHWCCQSEKPLSLQCNSISPSRISRLFCEFPSQIAHFQARALKKDMLFILDDR